MLASPSNPSDLMPIRGSYSHRISLPSIPGYEGVGVVEDTALSYLKVLLVNVFYLCEGKVLGKNMLKHQRN